MNKKMARKQPVSAKQATAIANFMKNSGPAQSTPAQNPVSTADDEE
jgi:hypothetical protein